MFSYKIDLNGQPELKSTDLNILADSQILYTSSLYDTARETGTVKSKLESSGKQLCDMSFLLTPSFSEHGYVISHGNLLSDYNDATTITAYLFWVLNILNCKRGL